MATPDPDDDFIEEDPMTYRELHDALIGHLTRSERRKVLRAFQDAGLIVFLADVA